SSFTTLAGTRTASPIGVKSEGDLRRATRVPETDAALTSTSAFWHRGPLFPYPSVHLHAHPRALLMSGCPLTSRGILRDELAWVLHRQGHPATTRTTRGPVQRHVR